MLDNTKMLGADFQVVWWLNPMVTSLFSILSNYCDIWTGVNWEARSWLKSVREDDRLFSSPYWVWETDLKSDERDWTGMKKTFLTYDCKSDSGGQVL